MGKIKQNHNFQTPKLFVLRNDQLIYDLSFICNVTHLHYGFFCSWQVRLSSMAVVTVHVEYLQNPLSPAEQLDLLLYSE